uniref:lysozyme n=1 Tax=Eptatretus burgeri TaxID=7764 RepID=A0A8C4Q4V8_EPTBU
MKVVVQNPHPTPQSMLGQMTCLHVCVSLYTNLSTGVCMAFAESSYKTDALHKNNDDSIDYGIFQINNHYWCKDDKNPRNGCNVLQSLTCVSLVVINICGFEEVEQSPPRTQIIHLRFGKGSQFMDQAV